MPKRILSTFSDEEFAKIVSENTSLRKIGLALGYSPNLGSGFLAIRKRIEELNLSTEHFTNGKEDTIKWTRDTAFQENTLIGSTRLRKLFLEEHTQDYVCSICGQLPQWKGKPLTLILDHIDGNHTNNTLSNLRWVCPNCNQQLDTTGSKNKKQEHQQKYCIDCGTPVSDRSLRCRACSSIDRNNKHYNEKIPSREILKKEIREKTFEDVAKKYGYKSGNAVKRWCKHYGLPYRRLDINNISDKEWRDI